jgi:L-alanine-DL-glutamate epimerase-like enolase superfamily enzyme
MKITDLKCTVMGSNPVVRITTDQGIDGFAQVENSKSYLKPHVLFYRDRILGQDPRDVERVMLRIRQTGGHTGALGRGNGAYEGVAGRILHHQAGRELS